jgi:hypothetical protein
VVVNVEVGGASGRIRHDKVHIKDALQHKGEDGMKPT